MSFTAILNLSISASWLVLAVLLARLVLKKAPRALHCALWALVAIRLLCPFSLESSLSLQPTREVIPREYLTAEPARQDTPARLDLVTNPVYDTPVTLETNTTVDRIQHWDLLSTVVWLTVMGAMAIYAAYSYLSLRLRVRMAAWTADNVWECDDLASPFILGILRPRIYLPSDLDEQTRQHVLAHENAHLRRLDHLWKPLGFLLLAIHWFNPVMWLAYVLLCRDIELACDERVIWRLDKGGVRAYSESLIRCAVPHRAIALCPLAFGEIGVKSRIRAMTRYKKPGLLLTLAAVIVSILLAACFLTDPVEPSTAPVESTTPGTEPGTVEEHTDPVKTVLIYRPEGMPAFTAPEFRLCSGDTFVLMESAFTSYHGHGSYTLEDGTLELRADDGRFTCVFTQEEDAFVYDRGRSNDYLYYDNAENFGNADYLPHGTRFVLTDCQLLASQRLDAAICAELLMRYCKPDADGRINAVSYDILDHSFVSGTPAAGSTEHTSRLNLCIAAQCSSYCVSGGSLTEESTEVVNVYMTFLTNGNALELTGMSDSKSYKLNQFYSPAAMEIWDAHKETILESLSSQCREKARQQLLALDADSQIQAFLDIICASPAPYSYPGAYIAAHPEEYDWLVSMGDSTVRHCFAKFAGGGQTGLEGHIMALACREIIGQTEGVYSDETYMTGQDWFNAFAALANQKILNTDRATFYSTHPYHAMALDALGIL